MDELMVVDPDSIPRFFRRWHGGEEGPPADGAVPADRPAPLRDWFALVNRWTTPRPRAILSAAEMRPVTLGWGGSDEETERPVLLFWEPLSAGAPFGPVFAVDPADPDPPVLIGGLEDDVLNDWSDTDVPLSRFLVVVAVADALIDSVGPALTLRQLTAEQMDEVTGSLLPLTDPLWAWENGSWYWCSAEGDLLAHGHHVGPHLDRGSSVLDWAGPEWDVDEDEYAVRLVALRPEALAPFERLDERFGRDRWSPYGN